MLSIGALNNGIVLDHIEAGKAMEIYRYLDLDNLDCGIAIIKNAGPIEFYEKCCNAYII